MSMLKIVTAICTRKRKACLIIAIGVVIATWQLVFEVTETDMTDNIRNNNHLGVPADNDEINNKVISRKKNIVTENKNIGKATNVQKSITTWNSSQNEIKSSSSSSWVMSSSLSSSATESPTNKALLQPPYRIVQIGSPRTGSTFQYALLIAIVFLKESQHRQHTITTSSNHFVRTDFVHDFDNPNNTERFLNSIQSNQSFVYKTHHEYPILKKVAEEGSVQFFSSGGSGSSFSIYVQKSKSPKRELQNLIDQSFFDLSSTEIQVLEEYMSIFSIVRQCCGLQMSKYEVLRLNGCNMTKHIPKPGYPRCEIHDDHWTDIDTQFDNSPIPNILGGPKTMRPGNCIETRQEVASGIGFNGKRFDGCSKYHP